MAVHRVRALCAMILACAAAAPAFAASDQCADAPPVGEGVFAYDTRRATGDGPNPCASVGSRNVWLKYTATATGSATVSTCGSNFGPDDQQSVVAVYSGSCAAPVHIACSFSGCGLGSSVTFAATAGVSYLVQIGGGCDDCTSSGVVTIANAGIRPTNDLCATAAPVGNGVHPFTNLGAMLDGSASCAETVADVWFVYTPDRPGVAEISTCGSDFDTVLSVSEGAACPGFELACSDNNCRSQSFLSVPVIAGQSYLVRVAGAAAAVRGGSTGVGRLTTRVLNPPVNDSCRDAVAVGEGAIDFTTVAARIDGPDDCERVVGDVWFAYTPSLTGLATITAGGFDTVVAVYAGDCGRPSLVACDNDFTSVEATVRVAVTAGQTLLVRVGGNGTEGAGVLSIGAVASPGNDTCASAANLVAGTAAAFSTRGAATDGPPPSCIIPTDQFYHDVWFAAVMPASGDAVVSTCGSLFDTILGVYDGCPETGGVALVCDDDSCSDGGPSLAIVRGVSAGQRLLIRIGGAFNIVGDGVVSVSVQSPPCRVLPEPASITEAEPCGSDTNGGCASDTPAFQDLPCAASQSIYGTAFASDGTRDTDWYRVTLPVSATITWGGRAEFPAFFEVRTGPLCVGNELARAVVRTPCDGPALASVRVPAGTYHLTVYPADFWSGASCGGATGSHYLATLLVACDPSGACCAAGGCEIRTAAACAAAGGAYRGDNTACDATQYLVSTCGAAFESIAATGRPGPECDSCEARVPLGFAFTFFGKTYTEAYVNANGFLSFGPSPRGTDHPVLAIPRATPNALIAPFWTDLSAVLTGNVRTQTLGTPGSRRFIAQWTGVPRGFDTDSNTFEVLLNEADGSIDFRYQQVSPTLFDDQTFIGVEDENGGRVASFSPMSPLDGVCLHLSASGSPVCGGCVADFNHSGAVSVQDIFDFLAAYFVQDPRADVNHSGGVSVQDIFDFLGAYFAGC